MRYKVAVDAMGGDNAPLEVIKGVAMAMKADEELDIVLIGDREIIENEWKKTGVERDIEIIDTDQCVEMHESPKEALLEKPRASINLAARILGEDGAEALVSAGNTGATVLAAAQNLPMIEGIERTGLAAIYPTAKFHKESHGFALMLDVGATLKCTSKQLVHFAIMGSYYVSHLMDLPNPRVALLNIGTEATKGGETLTKTYRYLEETKAINFIGNVEGSDIAKGVADVIVTDGFVGNVVLKLLEGVSDILKETGKYAFKKKISWKVGIALLAGGVKQLRARTDYSEYGGAPILGFKKLAIKAHGRSNAKAIANAIGVAERSIKEDICNQMAGSIVEFNRRHRMDFMEI